MLQRIKRWRCGFSFASACCSLLLCAVVRAVRRQQHNIPARTYLVYEGSPFGSDPAVGDRQPDTLGFLHGAVKCDERNRADRRENEVLFPVLSQRG